MDDLSAEVRRYLRYLHRYWYVLVFGALAGLLGWAIVAARDTADIKTVRVVVLAERWPGVSTDNAAGTLYGEDPEILGVAVARVAGTDSLTDVSKGTNVKPKQITFLVDGRRVLVQIRATSQDAATIAKRLAERLTEFRLANILQPITAATSAVELRIDSLTSEAEAASTGPDRAAFLSEQAHLTTELGTLKAAADAAPTEVQSDVVKTEVADGLSPTDPGSLLMGLVFAIGGFALGGVVVIFWSVLDRRIMSRRDVEAITGDDSLVAVLSSKESDAEVQAAAAAIHRLHLSHPDIALVGLGGKSSDRLLQSLSDRAGVRSLDVESVLTDPVPMACIVVLPVGKVSDRELRRTQFVLDRAGVQTVLPILCEARHGIDALD